MPSLLDIQHLRADGSVAPGWPPTVLELGPVAQYSSLCTDVASGTT